MANVAFFFKFNWKNLIQVTWNIEYFLCYFRSHSTVHFAVKGTHSIQLKSILNWLFNLLSDYGNCLLKVHIDNWKKNLVQFKILKSYEFLVHYPKLKEIFFKKGINIEKNVKQLCTQQQETKVRCLKYMSKTVLPCVILLNKHLGIFWIHI